MSFSAGTAPINFAALGGDLTITTPKLLVAGATSARTGTASQFAFTTPGKVLINRPAGALAGPGISSEIGGNLQVTAASIDLEGTIQAQAGTVRRSSLVS